MITRNIVKSLDIDINAALKQISEKYGIALNLKSIRFSSETLKISIDGVAGGLENPNAALENDFKRNYICYGLTADALGKTFISGGQEFKIIGSKSRNSKMPIIAMKVSTGQKYKFPASNVAFLLKK